MSLLGCAKQCGERGRIGVKKSKNNTTTASHKETVAITCVVSLSKHERIEPHPVNSMSQFVVLVVVSDGNAMQSESRSTG